jgi:hypothetical protein
VGIAFPDSSRPAARTAARDPELCKLRDDPLPLRGRTHLFIHVQDPAVDADIKGPSRREWSVFVHNAVRRRDRSGRVAEKRVVDPERLGEGLVRLRRIDADGKVCDVERPDVVAALTERLAGRGSASGECFGEPCENHSLFAFVVGQAVSPAI